MTAALHVLFVEDSTDDVVFILHELHQSGFDPVWHLVDNETDYLAHLHNQYDVILSDFSMPCFDARRALALLRQHGLMTPVIIITGMPHEEVALECIAQGAVDYLHKDRLKRLGPAVLRALDIRQMQHEKQQAQTMFEECAATLHADNARLNSAVRSREDLLANMSHELRTPLGAVLSLSETLQSELEPVLTEAQRQYLGIIEESGKHLLALLNDILDIARADANNLHLEKVPVLVEAIAQASLRIVSQAAEAAQIDLQLDLGERDWLIQADERRLKQILVNLLCNAIKFTPAGGRAGLSVAGDVAQQQIHFTVWDTGIGIDKEDKARLFEPFVQMHQGIYASQPGSGLGLAIVARLVRLHGGTIAVDNQPGEGSRFVVSLPWKPVHQICEPDSATPPVCELVSSTPANNHGATRARVLLAEDNEQNLMLLHDYLQSHNYMVIEARTGSLALEQAHAHMPDIILLDIQMPVLNGYEVIGALRSTATLAHIPIVAVTALTMPGDRERCFAAGADSYLSKPYRLIELLQTMEALLARGPEDR